jgi:hypothetical protein
MKYGKINRLKYGIHTRKIYTVEIEQIKTNNPKTIEKI